MKANRTRIAGVVLCLFVSLLARSAAATPSILGVFTGSFTGSEFNCRSSLGGPIVQPGPVADSFAMTLTVNDQQGNSFSANGTTNDNDSISVSGSVHDTGMVAASFSFTASDGISGGGSISGTLSGDSLSLSISGSDASGPGSLFCEFQYSGTMTRASSGRTNPELTAPTNITSPTELRSFTRLFSQSLTQRFNVFRSGVSGGATAAGNGFMLQSNGVSAGDTLLPHPFGVWGSFSRTDSKDTSAARTFKSQRLQFLGGVDISPWEDVLVGVALGYENADVKTAVNGGRQDVDGFTLAPYLAARFTDWLSADVSVGASSIDIKQSRVLAGTTLASTVDSLRSFIAANLNASHGIGDLLITGHAGTLYARDRQDSFTETGGALSVANAGRTFKLGQVRLGIEASWLVDEFEPFASMTFEHDYTSTGAAGASIDRNGGVLGVGLRYFGARNGISGSIDYQAIIGRRNLDEGTLGVNLRMDF